MASLATKEMSTGQEPEDDSTVSNAVAERKALRNVDWHVLPIISLYYIISVIDRLNIGNGRLYGLEEDLKLKRNQFQTAASVLFASYIASEVPSTIFLKKLHPIRFLSGITILWGVIASLTGLVQNYSGLIACRLLLGLAEGPLFPCLILYMTLFYTRKEIAVRFGFLISSAAFAGAVGGLLAYAIGHIDGLHGLRAWRWLLIIEGLPSICLGVFGWFFLADSPESAWYLSPSERQIIVLRRVRDQREASTASAQNLHRSDVFAAFKDWKIWVFSLANFGADIQLTSYAVFLPTIIQAINPEWSNLKVQALTVPCYALSALTYIIAAFISDAIQHRAAFCILAAITSLFGHVMLISGRGVAVQYIGCFVVASGIFLVAGIALVWLPTNLPRYGKRSTGVGMQLMIGNSAGIAAPYLYPNSDEPRYKMGHSVTIAMLVLSIISYVVLWWAMARVNKRRRAGKEDWKKLGKTKEQVDELGDESPSFSYAL